MRRRLREPAGCDGAPLDLRRPTSAPTAPRTATRPTSTAAAPPATRLQDVRGGQECLVDADCACSGWCYGGPLGCRPHCAAIQTGHGRQRDRRRLRRPDRATWPPRRAPTGDTCGVDTDCVSGGATARPCVCQAQRVLRRRQGRHTRPTSTAAAPSATLPAIPCADGQACRVDADCAGDWCYGTPLTCQAQLVPRRRQGRQRDRRRLRRPDVRRGWHRRAPPATRAWSPATA